MRESFVLFLFFTASLICSQEKQKISILKNTQNWRKEIIKFPIEWAPNLKVTGFEELHFSPKWAEQKSDQFWSLVIAWEIDAVNLFSLNETEKNLKSYFDGLMKPNHWSKDFPNPKVKLSNKTSENSKTNFTGEMTFFDGFYTGKVITVHIKGEQFFCEKQNKAILIFRLSPKKYNHSIWKTLDEFELVDGFCEE